LEDILTSNGGNVWAAPHETKKSGIVSDVK